MSVEAALHTGRRFIRAVVSFTRARRCPVGLTTDRDDRLFIVLRRYTVGGESISDIVIIE